MKIIKIKDLKIKIIQGDITTLPVKAIVNPTNVALKMEEGIGKRICRRGGEAIEIEALSKAPIGEGKAVVTKAGKLKADYIIHVAAAVLAGNPCWDQEIVREAAANALKCAQELGINSLAFPPLGCEPGAFPLAGSAKIMAQEILKVSRDPRLSLKEIIFCLPDRLMYETFEKTLDAYVRHIQEDLGPGPYVTVDIIIEFPQGIILVERANPPYGWALPGGFLDRGESLEQAATREAKEETGLDLENMRQFHTYSEPGRDPRFQTISTVFIAEGRGEPRFGDDAKNLKIVRYEDLPELDYAFDHKKIIKEYLIERNFD